jgi:hypothetical protein
MQRSDIIFGQKYRKDQLPKRPDGRSPAEQSTSAEQSSATSAPKEQKWGRCWQIEGFSYRTKSTQTETALLMQCRFCLW